VRVGIQVPETLLGWLRVEYPEKEEGRIQKAKAAVIFTLQSNRDGRVVKSLERRFPDGRKNAWPCRANCFQYPGGDLSRPANPQARPSALLRAHKRTTGLSSIRGTDTVKP
jgi:hypothetical protein